MQDDVSIIDEDPTPCRLAFHAHRKQLILALEHFLDLVRKRFQGPLTGSTTDDEVIGDRRDLLKIEQEDVLTFFVFEDIDDLLCQY